MLSPAARRRTFRPGAIRSLDVEIPTNTAPPCACSGRLTGSALLGSVLLSLSILVSCSPPLGRSAQGDTAFAAVVGDYFSGAASPEGIDRAFWRLSAEGDSDRYDRARASLDRLRRIDTSGLSLERRIDWLLLEATLRRTLKDSLLRAAERVPARYLTLGSLEWTLGDGSDARESDWRSALETLRGAPRILDLGRNRLKDPPRLWIDLAVGTIARLDAYLSDRFVGVVLAYAPVPLRDSLVLASETAQRALSSYSDFLRDSVVAGGPASWAVGSEYYDWVLREYHFLPFDVDGMIRKGWEVHERTKRELRELAEASGTGRTWQELVAEMKDDHPDPHHVTDAYIRESNRAQRLIREARMIDIPPAETLLFVPTPPALRETYAWGGYGGIVMRDSVMTGRFFVTDIDDGMGQLQQIEKLRTQNKGWITVIALHEGYPGHHLQALYARMNPNDVRSRLGSTYFGEGWALYCESWMARNGFYVDRWDSLGWLNMRLWRTARVILDPSLHAGRMSYDDAVTFFMQEVGLERSAAEAEVNRYTTWPTQAPSYIIGWLEIEKLRASLQERFGTAITEKAFAESMLKAGSLPPALLSRSLHAVWEEKLRAVSVVPTSLSH